MLGGILITLLSLPFPSALEHFWHIGTVYCQCLFYKKKGQGKFDFCKDFFVCFVNNALLLSLDFTPE